MAKTLAQPGAGPKRLGLWLWFGYGLAMGAKVRPKVKGAARLQGKAGDGP